MIEKEQTVEDFENDDVEDNASTASVQAGSASTGTSTSKGTLKTRSSAPTLSRVIEDAHREG